MKNKQNKEKNITKQYTPEEAKDLAIGITTPDMESSINTIAKDLLPALDKLEKKPGQQSPVTKELLKEMEKVSIGAEMQTHNALGLLTSKKYSLLAIEFCKQLITEYQCKTASEIALAELITASYVRYLWYCELVAGLMKEYIDPKISSYVAILSKEADKCHRAFITSLTLLRQFKNPPIELNIKATTAFVAQNQQVNATARSNPYEKIKSK